MHPQNDLIHTPNATIGVRGTDHEATVILLGSSGAYPSGTYDKVNQGITFIRTDKGEIDIYPNQVGLAVNMEEIPALLKGIPDFYNNDSSLKDKNNLSEQGTAGEGSADKKMEESTPEQTGKGAEIDHPSETGSASSEPPGNPIELGLPESAAPPELPESPALPELPETPSIPELPESPAIPES